MRLRSAVSAIILGSTSWLAACSSDPDPTVVTGSPPSGEPTYAAEEPRPGLVVDRWSLPEAGPLLDAVLAAVEPQDPASIPGTAAMQRNGFRVLIVGPQELELLRRTLGADGYRGRTWHGEAIGWRNLASRRLGRGTVLLLDGRARRMDDRTVALAARGYSIPTVEDAAIHVELAPYLVESSIDPMSTRRLGDLRGIPLCRGIECTLEPGEAVVIASIPRLRRGSTPAKDAGEATPTGSDAPTEDADPTPVAGIGAGPVAPLPPTTAELLLDDTGVRNRGLMIITGRPHPSVRVLPTEPTDGAKSESKPL
ncbi:MAG: hypothetical protein CMJ27_02470 [Phycisphaerae bacterium]|nr:hypothetical protein [Phycisphaerae bacterium]RPH15859.1 MAG: hypothetical protein CBC49_004795 [Alphaproteobacteria bacterium TMED89]